MPYAEPFSFLSLRFVLAIMLLGCLMLIARAPWPGWRLAAHSMVVGILLHGLYLGAVFWAIDRGLPAGISAMIVGLQPILVAVLAWPLLGETGAALAMVRVNSRCNWSCIGACTKVPIRRAGYKFNQYSGLRFCHVRANSWHHLPEKICYQSTVARRNPLAICGRTHPFAPLRAEF